MACCNADDKIEFTQEQIKNLFLYYKKLMPLPQLYKWFGYGNRETFAKREISFTLTTGTYIRYLSFDTYEQFYVKIQKLYPAKIDIGAIYETKPKIKALGLELTATEKDLVFDIDISDYDEVRTCCTGSGICSKCWKFMAIASKIITAALKEDFDYKHFLWVFSGRRGIHCWVADKNARELTKEARSAITDYLTLLKNNKKVNLNGGIHKKIYERALKIIDEYFLIILEEQDLLGTDLSLKKFLSIINKEVRKQFEKSMTSVKSSIERWQAFEKTFAELQEANLKNLREEIKLQFTYPRLDVRVSKSLDHLLKAPFCIHPKTDKICIPFDVKLVDEFDPDKVPTVSTIIEEMNKYDEDFQEQLKNLKEEDTFPLEPENYQKTSLWEPIDFLRKFIDNFEKE